MEGKPNLTPMEYALQLIDEAPQLLGFTLEQAAEMKLADLVIALHPEIEPIHPNPRRIYYRLSEKAAGDLVGASYSQGEAFAVLVQIVHANIFNGEPLPLALRNWAASRIIGSINDPPKRSHPPKNFVLRWLAYRLILNISWTFELPLTRSEGSSEYSACDIACEALQLRGHDTKYTRFRDWCNHNDHAAFRAIADGLSAYIADLTLKKMGLIKNLPSYGVFAELSRSRG